MFEPEELMARIVDLEEQLKVSEMAPPAAEQLIACLEGEIAKRDARIVELEAEVRRWVIRIQQRGLEMDDLSEELKVAHTNISRLDDLVLSLQCKVIERDAELAAIKAQEPLTVEFMQFLTDVVTGAGLLSHGKQSKGLASELSATAYKYMLGAQVSGYQQKPIGYRCWFNKEPKNIMVEWGKSLPSDMNPSATYQALYAAQAAPAADAGIVDMYRHLQKVTPYRFKKIQDASITDGGDVMYFHKDRFDAALLADMAAHCAAKGVV